MPSRPGLALLPALAAGLLVSACGSSSSGSSPAARLATAATKTEALKSFRFLGTLAESATGTPAPVSETDRLAGEVNLAQDRSHISIASGTTPAQTLVQVGDRVWITIAGGSFVSELPAGRSWVATTFAAARAAGADIQSPGETLGLYGYLRGATHVRQTSSGYAFTVDPAAALADAPPAQRAGVKSALTLPTGSGVKSTITGTAQLTPAGQARAMAVTVVATAREGSRTVRVKLTVESEISGINAPAVVSAPPAAQSDSTNAAGLEAILRKAGLQPSEAPPSEASSSTA
jgi:hypothetical protein